MSDDQPQQIAFVREHEATGHTAELFADIRATLGLATVNLIWRHLAATEGALECAWAAARPIYASGRVGAAVASLAPRLVLPRIEAITAADLGSAGVKPAEHALVGEIVAAYNRGNAFNLVTLSALVIGAGNAETDNAGTGAGGDPDIVFPAPVMALPRVPELHEMSAPTASTVLALNRLGADDGTADIVATLYKHAAHWPALPALLHARLAPLDDGGVLARLAHEAGREAAQAAAPLAAYRGAMGDTPAAAVAMRSVQTFVQHVICRLLPIGLMLRAALASGGETPD